MKGGGQLAELPGRAENLKNCSCCCHGSVLLLGGDHLPLVSVSLYILVFPYICFSVDCFEWVLIGNIEKHRVHLELCQFQLGVRGGLSAFGICILIYTGISLYFLIS